jgi:DNA ligase-1
VQILEVALQPIAKIVNELRSTSGSNDKIKVLKKYADTPHLQEIFKWTYDPFLKYGVSKKMIESLENANVNRNAFVTYYEFEQFMDTLAKSNINDDLRSQIADYLHHPTNQTTVDLLKCIFTKDLKIGMAAASINKAIPGLIPVFDVMRGQKYSDHKHKLVSKDIIITEKIDGVRTVAIIDENGDVKFYSRQGKEWEGLVEIEEDVKSLGLKNIVLDGETTILNQEGLESKEVFKRTMEIMGSKQERKTGLLYNVFDCVPLSQFKAGKCSASASNRKKWFLEKYTKEWTFGGYEHVKPLPVLYEGVYREEAVKGFHQNILRRGGEGIMINIASAPYECKRTANLLKVKEMYTMDLKIIGFEEGLVGSKFEGTLGAIVVDYKGHEVKVGSGYTDDERKFFWENKDDLIGRVTEVQYFEETEDTDGNLSLRFPVYVQLREVGKEVSYD